MNQPHADFARPENVAAFAAALRARALGRGRRRSRQALAALDRRRRASRRRETLTSVDPARPRQVVGTAAYGGEAEAERAVAAARAAFAAWRDAAPAERAAVLFRAAELMRAELFELAALEVFEAGKTWREADADVGEAIDFLEYYGREILRLEPPGQLGPRAAARTRTASTAARRRARHRARGTSRWRSSPA